MKKVLVTGGSGYIGRYVTDALHRLGADVYVADLKAKPSGKDWITSVNTSIFADCNDLFEKLGKPDVVVHLAWRDGFQHNSDAHIDDLAKHYHFIKAMMEGGLGQIVGMGSMHEVGYYEGAISEDTPTNPQSMYGVAKNTLRQATQLLAAKNDVTFQWLRGYYITGDDLKSQSVFRKILEADARGDKYFPFVSGEKKYDFIDVQTLGLQIAAVAVQDKVTGIINCSSGKAMSLGERAEQFIKDNHLKLSLQYGVFPDRPYDSPAVWGDDTKIQQILSDSKL